MRPKLLPTGRRRSSRIKSSAPSIRRSSRTNPATAAPPPAGTPCWKRSNKNSSVCHDGTISRGNGSELEGKKFVALLLFRALVRAVSQIYAPVGAILQSRRARPSGIRNHFRERGPLAFWLGNLYSRNQNAVAGDRLRSTAGSSRRKESWAAMEFRPSSWSIKTVIWLRAATMATNISARSTSSPSSIRFSRPTRLLKLRKRTDLLLAAQVKIQQRC